MVPNVGVYTRPAKKRRIIPSRTYEGLRVGAGAQVESCADGSPGDARGPRAGRGIERSRRDLRIHDAERRSRPRPTHFQTMHQTVPVFAVAGKADPPHRERNKRTLTIVEGIKLKPKNTHKSIYILVPITSLGL